MILGIVTQKRARLNNKVGWAKIAAHRIQRDFHASKQFADHRVKRECKNENRDSVNRRIDVTMTQRWYRFSGPLCGTPSKPVVLYNNRKKDKPCARNGCCRIARTYLTVAMPTIRRFARAQPHLRGFTFWNTHKLSEREGKQKTAKRQQGSDFRIINNASFRKPDTLNPIFPSTSAYPARSIRFPCARASLLRFQLSLLLRTRPPSPDHANAGRAAGSTRYPHA